PTGTRPRRGAVSAPRARRAGSRSARQSRPGSPRAARARSPTSPSRPPRSAVPTPRPPGATSAAPWHASRAGWRRPSSSARRPSAAASPRPARVVYRALPPATAKLPADARAALLRALARIDPRLAASLAELAPVTGAVLAEVPPAERLAALGLVEELAAAHPEAAVAALCVLPQLYEEAGPAEVRRWFAAGTAVAAENAAAGRAYFALESRTSLAVLRAASTAAALADTQGVWRKLVQMLSGAPVVVRGVEVATLRPPLEDLPAEHEVALPLRVDWLPTHDY